MNSKEIAHRIASVMNDLNQKSCQLAAFQAVLWSKDSSKRPPSLAVSLKPS